MTAAKAPRRQGYVFRLTTPHYNLSVICPILHELFKVPPAGSAVAGWEEDCTVTLQTPTCTSRT